VAAVVTLSKGIDWLMNNHYSVTFHGIIGLVTASTVLTIPFGAFTASVPSCLIHIAFVLAGCICTLLLDKFNSKVEKPPVEQ
jgi:putative membrane protein